MYSSTNQPANDAPRRSKTVHFTPENSSNSNNAPTQNTQRHDPDPDYSPNMSNPVSNPIPTPNRPKHAPGRRRTQHLNRIGTNTLNWLAHRDFKIWYNRRVELEQHLLNATIALPSSCGLSDARIEELRRTLRRDGRVLPRTERDWERDDLPRVHAVIDLIKARQSVGAETDATMEKWNNIVIFKEFDRESDERKIDIVLVELEKRKDAEWLVRMENHIKYRTAISNLFEETAKLPQRCGLTKPQINLLRPVFSGHSDRANVIEAWWQRRNALICILRARKQRFIRGEPENNGTYDGYVLPDPESPNLRELCEEEDEFDGDVEGRVVGTERIGLGSVPSPQEVRMMRLVAELHEYELSPIPETVKRDIFVT